MSAWVLVAAGILFIAAAAIIIRTIALLEKQRR
jgi:hypothetical protein